MRVLLPSTLTLALVSALGCSDGPTDDAPDDSNGSDSSSAGGASNAGPNTSGGPTATTSGSNAASSNTGSGDSGGSDGSGGSGGSGNANDTATSANTTGSGDSGGTGGSGGVGGSGGSGGSAGGATDCEVEANTNPGRVCIKGKQYYLNGINVAWDQWTADLTNYDAARFEDMFSSLEASGGNSVRWWWFIDGGNQLSYSGNLVQPLSQNIFDNLDVAFDAAAAHGVLIMPVFLSFDIETQGREFLVTDPAATDAFVTNVVIPLVERYNDHPGLGLWEIMNEGDWLLSDEGGTVSTADYQRFHAKMAAGVHAADADALVTTGSASFKYLEDSANILADEILQAAAGGDALAYLDVYQIHYYGWMHGEGWSYEPWIKSSSEWNSDGKPILVGEFPCRGEDARWSTLQMHVESVNQGFAGSFCWAYLDNRADAEGTWTEARPAVEAIAAQIPGAITGE